MSELIPADKAQCQSEIYTYHPFTMGGNVSRRRRCTNKPAHIVRELKAGDDGLKGEMSMCPECLAQFTRQTKPKFGHTHELVAIE